MGADSMSNTHDLDDLDTTLGFSDDIDSPLPEDPMIFPIDTAEMYVTVKVRDYTKPMSMEDLQDLWATLFNIALESVPISVYAGEGLVARSWFDGNGYTFFASDRSGTKIAWGRTTDPDVITAWMNPAYIASLFTAAVK